MWDICANVSQIALIAFIDHTPTCLFYEIKALVEKPKQSTKITLIGLGWSTGMGLVVARLFATVFGSIERSVLVTLIFACKLTASFLKEIPVLSTAI